MSATGSDTLREIRNLTLRRGGRCLLEGITLDVGEGEIHVLLGGNGCGKTSLAKSVMGGEGYRPDRGEIRFAARPLDDLPLYERAPLGITMSWQEPARFEGVGVRDFLTLKRPEADAHRPFSMHDVPGVAVRVRRRLFAVAVDVTVEPGAEIASPVHLCFGMSRPTGAQRVRLTVRIGAGASVRFLARCLFARARHASHRMWAQMHLKRDARLTIEEGHVHGAAGHILVTPRAHIRIGPGARLFSEFSLLQGRVGRLRSDYTVDVAEHGVAELGVRVLGRADDSIELRDHIRLNGIGTRGMVKTRVALTEQARAIVYGIAEGNAAEARGPMDCTEIVKDQASGESVPVVRVGHPETQVTHEAAIGTVDQAQLETLMAHGLAPDEAIELVISGLPRPEPAPDAGTARGTTERSPSP